MPTNIRLYIELGVLLILGLVIAWLAIARANDLASLATANASYAMCQSANSEFKAQVIQQDAAVKKLASEGEDLQRQVANAQDAAARITDKFNASAGIVINSQPQDSDDCKATKELITSYRKSHP